MSSLPKPSGQDDYREFLVAQLNPALSNEKFAASVCGLALFQTKYALAVAIAGRQHAQADDAGQQALITIMAYLAKTRGRAFQGSSIDELGAWLYWHIRKNIIWALQNIDRGDRRRRYHEQVAGQALMLHADVCTRDDRVATLVDAVAQLPDELRIIVAAILLGDEVATIIWRLGISRRTFYRLRERAFELLLRLMSDEDGGDDSSNLLPV